MGKKNGAVKKGSKQAMDYAKRVQAATEATNLTIFHDGMQHAFDIASIVLHETFGFGTERLKKFGINFSQKFNEVENVSRMDKEDDKDQWYSEEQFESMLREAWGQYYTPRTERYSQ